MSKKVLDTSGLRCPLPLLKTQKELSQMASGEMLSVISTDPGTQQDFKVLTEQMGHALLSSEATAGKYYYCIQKQ